MGRFYQNWYRNVYQSPMDGGVAEEWTVRAAQTEQRFAQINSVVKLERGSTVVDVGCNFGSLLAPFQAAGMDVWGCDLGGEHLEYGRSRLGLTQLVTGDAQTLISKDVQADLIILDHVFEHFADPLEELRHIVDLLKPGGRVFVSVPGTWWWTKNVCGSDFLALLQNAHCFQYDLETLTETFARLGFEPEYGDEHVTAVFRHTGNIPTIGPAPERAVQVLRRLQAMGRLWKTKHFAGRVLRAVGLHGIVSRALAQPIER